MKEASKEFIAVLSCGGTLVAECVCGHTHFATNHEGQGHYDEGELNKLTSLAEVDPKRYTNHADSDTVHVAWFNGITYVIDCPCERLAKVEETLWRIRAVLLQYYSLRMDKEKSERQEAETLLTSLAGKGE